MLGETLGHEVGQITGTRVLGSATPGAPAIEVSFTAEGTLLGRHSTDMGTYAATARPDGFMAAEGQGVVTTEDGELVTWTAQAVGRMAGKGMAADWRGAAYYITSSERLSQLNGICGIFEFSVDESGKTEAKLYEWK
jgi:hypothetical protein